MPLRTLTLNEEEVTTTDDTAALVVPNQINQYNKTEILSNMLILGGTGAVVAGNTILAMNSILPWIPAGCFIAEAAVGGSVTGTRLVLMIFNNKNLEIILSLLNSATAPLLPIAVWDLNKSGLDPKLASVWGPFMAAAGISTFNHFIGMGELFAKWRDNRKQQNDLERQQNNSEQQQIGTYRKVMNNLTVALAPVGAACATFGVASMYINEINAAKDEETLTKVHESFIPVITGLTLITSGLGIKLVRNLIQWSRNCFSSNSQMEATRINGFINSLPIEDSNHTLSDTSTEITTDDEERVPQRVPDEESDTDSSSFSEEELVGKDSMGNTTQQGLTSEDENRFVPEQSELVEDALIN